MPKGAHEKREGFTRGISKKKYQAPRLAEYGDLRDIVLTTKRSNRNDGAGAPKTKR